jgi:DNA-binding winged helix-turn-helix (wHTH) protein/predicted ATPase
VDVEPQVFDLLHHLIRHRERVVSRDDLIADVWRGRIVSESALTSRITAVRQAIGDNGRAQRLIRTMPRKGFRFVGDVREGNQSPPSTTDQASAAPPATRRQLTVLACAVYAAAPSARVDPEDLHEVIAACQAIVKATVEQFGGVLGQQLADGALAYFGYPEAHEDDAERAVRAGLAAVQAVAALPTSSRSGRPALRIGIATGLVVVGDHVTSAGAIEHILAGEAPHLAGRLRAEAEAGEVVVSLETRRLTGGFFEYADGDVKAIGIRVRAESSVASRFDALRAVRSDLVGRKEELDLLLRRWRDVQAGGGRVVLISGEPGIGKSRLAIAVREAVKPSAWGLLRYDCSPHRTQTALFPVIHQLERAAGIQAGDGAAARRGKLGTLLRSWSDDPNLDQPLFGALLGVSTDADRATLSLSPQRQKELLLERLAAQLARLAERQPILLIVEDAHWIDQATREWCDILVERVRSLPVLLIMTYRPEFMPPWLGQSHVTALILNRLGRQHNARIIRQVAGQRALPSALIEQIIDRTDGIPLFIEEMTKSVLESDIASELDGELVLAEALPTLPMPATLQASLVARLDRLPSARSVVQTGAALGREFTYPLIKAVSGLDGERLQASLERLVSSGLVHCRGVPPYSLYTFKHALVQDAAHGTLLRTERKRLHAQIVRVLEQQFPDVPRQHPDELAYHCTEANLWPQAIEYRLQAARIALDRCAGAEAQAQVETAMALLASIPDASARQQLEGKLLALLGDCYVMTKGFASREVYATLSRARGLLDEAVHPILCLRTLCGLFNYHLMRSEAPLAMQLCAPNLRRPLDQLTAPVIEYLAGAAHLHMGNLKPACRHLEIAASLHQDEACRPTALIAGYNVPVFTQVWLGLAYLYRGAIARAVQTMAAAVEQARKESHPFTLVSAILAQARFFSHLRDIKAAIAATEEGHAIAADQRSPYHLSRANVLRVVNRIDADGSGSLAPAMERALAEHLGTGANYQSSYNISYLALAHGRAGEVTRALEIADRAIGEVEQSGERWWQAEAHRIKGKLLLIAARQKEAEECFDTALDCARRQGAKLWELQAAQSLAQLRSERGARVRGRNLLEAAYAGFSDGFETPPLQDAKRLLDLLR